MDETYYSKNKERIKKRNNDWNNANKEKLVNAKLRKRYGITLEEYSDKLKKQGYKCEICGRDSITYFHRMAVDHNHSTGKVRGIICNSCNNLVGYCERIINPYLDKYK